MKPTKKERVALKQGRGLRREILEAAARDRSALPLPPAERETVLERVMPKQERHERQERRKR